MPIIKSVKNIAIVEPGFCVGGTARFLRSLMHGLKQVRPELNITFFCTSSIEKKIEELAELNIQIVSLKAPIARFAKGLKWRIFRGFQKYIFKKISFCPLVLSGDIKKEIEKKVKNFDLVYFPFVSFVLSPNLDCHSVFTLHDFNYNYSFPLSNFSLEEIEDYNRQIEAWLQTSSAIVSTNYMLEELKKFHPKISSKIHVIRLASFSTISNRFSGNENKIVSDLGIKGDYILYPCNMCHHKNQMMLISAFSLLKKRFPQINLVFTGFETEKFNGKADYTFLKIREFPQDVFGLGYVTNDQMDALIQCAKVVVSTSVYEAGNGPGLDAWARATPVAMSKIPPFLEQCEFLGVKAAIFDPFSPRDIANEIETLLLNPEKARENALISEKAMQKYTWIDVARQYLQVFDETFSN